MNQLKEKFQDHDLGKATISVQNTQLAHMIKARHQHGICRVVEFIYVFAGHDGHTGLKECEKYNIVEDKWEAIADFPTAITVVY
jgi:hypothetical protein